MLSVSALGRERSMALKRLLLDTIDACIQTVDEYVRVPKLLWN